MSKTSRTIVADIAGGLAPLKRDVGSNLTIQHVWSYYRWYPGFKDLINLEVDAIFGNGINEDEVIDTTRLMECKESLRWALIAGYSCPVVDARDPDRPKVENWHPYIDGVGFQFTDFSPKGHPTEITVHMNTNETAGGEISFPIPHYPCELDLDGEFIDEKPLPNGYGFFHVRTQGNIRGIQGLPKYMHLIDAFGIQWDIIKAYGPFAEKQGMAMPVVYHEDNSPTNRRNVKTQFANQPTTNRLLQMSNKDLVEWVSPQANAYDPFPMLHWLNTVISRASQMNKLMIEGEPAGALASSTTAVSRWETKRKEDQTYWRTQFLGVWIALGTTDEVNFKPPVSPTFIDLANGMKALVEALLPVVEPEDIVTILNDFLASNDKHIELHALSKEEMMGNNDDEQSNNNNGDKTDKK
ncbi:hypothetical protein LCGC14_0566930 [marine sediment metagenome]|uniref:Uncharacterized protein n=1 Tax=marine sediment metagenome TaxID=412755 RepID=A0A0F9U6P3_9ZZZZ